MFTSVFCEKIIPTQKIVGRDIQLVSDFYKCVNRWQSVSTFIVPIGTQ